MSKLHEVCFAIFWHSKWNKIPAEEQIFTQVHCASSVPVSFTSPTVHSLNKKHKDKSEIKIKSSDENVTN